MKTTRMDKFSVISAVLVLTVASFVDVPLVSGDVIIPDQSIQLSESGRGAGKWDGRDLTIDYRYSIGRGGLVFSGVIDFADSIRYNYNWMSSFHAEVIIGDSRRRVIGTHSIATSRQMGMDAFEPIIFSQVIPFPPDAVIISFSYTGQVAEAGGGNNLTNIWNYPITGSGSTRR